MNLLSRQDSGGSKVTRREIDERTIGCTNMIYDLAGQIKPRSRRYAAQKFINAAERREIRE